MASIVAPLLRLVRRLRPLQSDRRLRLIADAAPALIAYVDAQQRYRFNNRAYEEWFGHPRREVYGRHVADVLGEDAYRRIRHHVEAALAGRETTFDMEILYKTGVTRFVRATYVPDVGRRGKVRGFAALVADITDRKQAEEAIRDANEKLRAVIEASPLAIFVLDRAGAVQMWNPAAERMYGWTAGEILGRALPYVPDDRQEEYLANLATVLQGEVFRGFELRRQRRDGSPVDVSVWTAPMRTSTGDIGGAVVVVADIGERKRAERELRESEERFRAMATTVPDIILTARPDGWCDYVNARFYEYTGMAPGAAEGTGWATAIHPEDVEANAAGWAASRMCGVPYEMKYRLRAADGTYRWFIARSRPILDAEGRITRWFGTCTDIDALVRAEEERAALLRREREARAEAEKTAGLLDALLASAPVGFAVLDGDLRYVLINQVLAEMNGLPVEQHLGRTVQEVLPDLAGRVSPFLRQVAETGQPILNLEVSVEGTRSHCDGRHYVLNYYPVRGHGGATFGVGVTLLDVTERKRAEEERARLLEHAEVARAEAEAANRAKDEFLAMLSHELRNPLAPVHSALEIIRRRGGDDPTLQRARDVMDRQIRHLTRLLDDLLDVSRITRGQINLQTTLVDLAAVVADAVEAFRGEIEARGHTLSVALPAEPVPLYADRTRLTQIVGNLLHNAAKYTPRDGRISVAVSHEGADAVLRVEDTGIGIPREMLGRVFDLFTQVDPSLARSEGGLGIGLTLVRSLVELHGGTVAAHSAGRGRGSVFAVRLPVAQAAEVAPGSARAAGDGRGPRRVLIIEDNRDTREMLAVALEGDGHSVLTADDGHEGLELAIRTRPDAVLIDIGLPGIDGYEVARRIRAHLGGKVSLIALTGYGQPEDRRRGGEAGFDVYLVKPAAPEALADILSQTGRAL